MARRATSEIAISKLWELFDVRDFSLLDGIRLQLGIATKRVHIPMTTSARNHAAVSPDKGVWIALKECGGMGVPKGLSAGSTVTNR